MLTYIKILKIVLICSFIGIFEADGASTTEHSVKTSFFSSGKKITVEKFSPAEAGQYPGIILLHGSGGLVFGRSELMAVARSFSTNGYHVFLVHYFNRTKTSFAIDNTIDKEFKTWMDAVHDSARFISKDPTINPKKIGVFGYSLGAYLALMEGARNPRIGAVVELAGGMHEGGIEKIKTMPPTLILHGEKDKRVLFSKAVELKNAFLKRKIVFQIKRYPNEGHRFSPLATQDAIQCALTFFNQHLKDK